MGGFALSSHATNVLIAAATEPLRRRRGSFVRSSQFDKPEAELFCAATVGVLRRERLITVRPRLQPRGYEARLTPAGRARATAALARLADRLAESAT